MSSRGPLEMTSEKASVATTLSVCVAENSLTVEKRREAARLVREADGREPRDGHAGRHGGSGREHMGRDKDELEQLLILGVGELVQIWNFSCTQWDAVLTTSETTVKPARLQERECSSSSRMSLKIQIESLWRSACFVRYKILEQVYLPFLRER
ncbi:hypothetical protein RRG08_047672 [Elysia crispata]|uniref:Uncharacterized protein n=1 Tax=Elysia crispata TaxID=231223 RepID=A0AAE1BCC6_9GAST|nr:hypothetical protein RRG08_047672 [Elysia crispata]